jgi:type VI protein secretion system component VasF
MPLAPVFGSTLQQDWTAAGWQLLYALAYAVLLAFRGSVHVAGAGQSQARGQASRHLGVRLRSQRNAGEETGVHRWDGN